MDAAIETAAQTIFETWGGPWVAASEFRKAQARNEARRVIEAIRSNPQAKAEAVSFLLEFEIAQADQVVNGDDAETIEAFRAHLTQATGTAA